MNIRNAVPADASAIREMIHELVEFEGIGAVPAFTVDQLAQALIDPPGRSHAAVAEDADGAAGFVSYTVDFAIWTGRDVVRIDDVFVKERARGRGVGRALMLYVADIAICRGLTCRWEIEPANGRAQRFYHNLGVEIHDKKVARWSLTSMRLASGK